MKLLPSFTGQPERNRIYHTEFFELCGAMPDNSVDMILCDLPYGTTACEWDNRIPLEPMWAAFKRIIKPNGAIVLTASQPFTSMLVMSNLEWFRYEWVWNKVSISNPLMALKMPLKQHENILIFSGNAINYYPIFTSGTQWHRGGKGKTIEVFNKPRIIKSDLSDLKYPKTIIKFSTSDKTNSMHATAKPVALFEYLIKTYTQEFQLVFDPCVGSGTTAVAAKNTSRDYICGDMMLEYVEIARKRVNPVFGDPPKRKREVLSMDSLPLFEGVM